MLLIPARRGVVAKYGARMEIRGSENPVTLHEGDTPLIPAPRLAEWAAPGAELFLKYEGLNPTGSFKDRGMTAAVTEARADGARTILCASTGNTAASAAAYAARAGMGCTVVIPDSDVALGKLAGALAYGANVVTVRGNFDDALRLSREAGESEGVALVNSVNQARLEGQKTGAWEVTEQLGEVPDVMALPVGNAGNLTSYWLGFTTSGEIKRPRMVGTQAAGSAPLVHGAEVDHPVTRATAIKIGRPARAAQARDAIRESDGMILAATDDEIFEAWREIARREGIFCEPSSAAGVAGLRLAVQAGRLGVEGLKIVCVLTGHGLKDAAAVLEEMPPPTVIEPQIEHLLRVMGL